MGVFCQLTLYVNIKSFFRKLFITLQGDKHGVISKQMSKLFDLWNLEKNIIRYISMKKVLKCYWIYIVCESEIYIINS